jgi:predicted metalloprotease with PDZ domain
MAQLLYGARSDYADYRRSVDYYDEGTLIWLDADVLIRRLSKGAKSLNDFCRAFHGGPGGAPALKPYTFDDVVAGLNSVQSYDWASFLRTRLQSVSPRAPLGGIEDGGWKLVYNSTRSELWKAFEEERKNIDLRYSLGLTVKEDGTVQDVAIGSPAYKAGVAPTDKVIAVDRRQFNPTILREAVQRTAYKTQSVELLVKSGEYFNARKIEYHGGERYPHLERDSSKADLLSKIVEPITTP